ncbi:hypothetical protein MUP46_01105 [Patescibacteria group bacterium]|nr:hypothetical protein [Patescibacteria group bacterium]
MKPEEIEDKKELYRQGLSMVFSKGVAEKSKVYYFEPKYRETGMFWVNRAFYVDSGALVLSPTGWKPFTPEEFDAETQSLFHQALDAELKMSEASK